MNTKLILSRLAIFIPIKGVGLFIKAKLRKMDILKQFSIILNIQSMLFKPLLEHICIANGLIPHLNMLSKEC